MTLLGCAEWHSSDQGPQQTTILAWNQVHIGMTRAQVYALMGKPRRENGPEAEWRGAEVKKRWPSDYPATTYWRQYEASFDANGRLSVMRDYDMHGQR